MKLITPILIIGLLALGGFFYFNLNQAQPNGPGNQIVTPSPASTTPDLTDQPLYTHPTLGFNLNVPENYTIDEITSYSVHLYPIDQPLGVGPANFIYISVIPTEEAAIDNAAYNYNPDQYRQLMSLTEFGQSISFADKSMPELAEWFTYTYVDNTTITGQEVRVFENNQPWEFPGGSIETRYLFEQNGVKYLLGYYTGGQGGEGAAYIDPREASAIIHTFRNNR